MPPPYQIEFLKGRNYFYYKLPKLDTTLYCQMAIKLLTQLMCLGPCRRPSGLQSCLGLWTAGSALVLLVSQVEGKASSMAF